MAKKKEVDKKIKRDNSKKSNNKLKKIYLLIGGIIGLVLSIINLKRGYFPPDLFGLLPCGKFCWGYWRQITISEMVFLGILIGWLYGEIKEKLK